MRYIPLIIISATCFGLDATPLGGGLGILRNVTPYEYAVNAALESQIVNDGIVVNDGAGLRVGGRGRFYGAGIHAVGNFVVEEDKNARYMPVGNGNYVPLENNFGEMKSFKFGADYLFDIGGIYGDDGPGVQILPGMNWETAPDETVGPKKNPYTLIGLTVWVSTPIEGIDFGNQIEYNIGGKTFFRGSFGFRQLYQIPGFEFTAWQFANYGSNNYKKNLLNSEHAGFSHLDIGGTATMPFIFTGTWIFAKASCTPWLAHYDRATLSEDNMNVAPVTISLGFEFSSH